MAQEEMTQVDTARIVHEINAEIARLTSARKILTGSNSTSYTNQHTRTAHANGVAKKMQTSRLSPAGRKKLSQLMKKRWAERRKKAASKAK
jgi:hypothetical protein